MDNSNNSNWPNNPNPTPNGVPPVAPDPLTANPFSNPAPISDMPSPAPTAIPTSTPSNPWDSVPAAIPTNMSSSLPQTPASNINPWDLPTSNPMPQTSSPVNSNPWNVPANPDPLASIAQTPSSLPITPDPVVQDPIPAAPLDNPWSQPAQPAAPVQPIQTDPTPIESGSTPTWLPNSPAQAPQMPQTPEATQPMPITTPTQNEPAPTDLSHLLSGNQQSDSSANNMSHTQSPETLVVPPTTPEASSTLPMENHKDIPKWLIGVGVGLLIIVTGASAYFILGVGQPPKTTSVPATQETTQQTIRNVAPAVVATSPAPVASQSATTANFGQLEGTGTTQQATSAADLLRQRQ